MGDKGQMPEDVDFVMGQGSIAPLRLVVEYTTGQRRIYLDSNWRIERVGDDSSFLVIGHGLPSVYIPLINVLSFSHEEIK